VVLAGTTGLLAETGASQQVQERGSAEACGAEDLQGISGLIQHILVKNLPDEYEDTSKWGRTKDIWDGLTISRDGLRLKTKRRTKAVNHGSWEKYRAWLIDPPNELDIRVENSRTVVGKGIGFDLVVTARLGAIGRWSEWQLGVQIYSISAEAEAKVQLRLACEVGLSLDLSGLPVAVLLEPNVSDAHLELVDFRLNRISKLDGPLARELGRGLRDVLRKEIARRRSKLVTRINAQIDKNRDKLRFSLNAGFDDPWESLFGSNHAVFILDHPEALLGHSHRSDPEAKLVTHLDGFADGYRLPVDFQSQRVITGLAELNDRTGTEVRDPVYGLRGGGQGDRHRHLDFQQAPGIRRQESDPVIRIAVVQRSPWFSGGGVFL